MTSTHQPSTNDPAGLDLVCAGETMVMFVPDAPGSVTESMAYRPTVAGAESNVACFAAQLGVRSAWVSRLGDDAFGQFVLDQLSGFGVQVDHVERDACHPTGIAFKEIAASGTRVSYYRAGSAASRMDALVAQSVQSLRARVVHLSGITAALSPSCDDLLRRLVRERSEGSLLSFDVNWRPSLWRGVDPGVLLDVARNADVVFVGEDEASDLWGVHGPASVRELLPEVPRLVVKQGGAGATAFVGDRSTFVPALQVEVVEQVGAGDAFAAGFLVGVLRDLSVKMCLRLGTITAAAALRVPSDVGPIPSPCLVDQLLALRDDEWGSARVGALEADLEV
jgi:2-dehydro-3-deoxygluconokinase